MSELSLNQLGSNIQARRQLLGLSQADVAELVAVSQGAISQWEQGATSITVENLVKLAAALSTNTSALLTGIEADHTLSVNEVTLAMALECIESGLNAKFKQLSALQKAKLLVYVYGKGNPLPKQELLSLLALVT